MIRTKRTAVFAFTLSILLAGPEAFPETDFASSPEELIAAGRQHIEAEEYEAAAAEFQHALTLGVATAEAYRGLCVSQIELKEYSKAAKTLAAFADLAAASPEVTGECSESAEKLVSQAKLLARIGHYEEGLRKCTQALADSPDCAPAHYSAALICQASGDERLFIEHALDALALNPDLPQKHSVLAAAHRIAEEADETLREAERAVALAPDDLDIQLAYAAALYNTDKYSDSLRAVSDVLEQDPDFGMAYVLLMAIKARQGDSKAADAAMEKAEQLVPPNDPKLWGMKILLSLTSQRFDRAIELASDYVRVYPDDVEVMGLLATAFMVTGQFGEAEETLQAALRQEPDSPEILGNLGAFYSNRNRLDEAIEILHKAIALDPDKPLPHDNLAACYVKKGMMEEAKAEQKIAALLRERDPGEGIQMFEFKADSRGSQVQSAEELRDRSLLNLGIILVEEGRFEEAHSRFLRALELEPGKEAALYYLAFCEIQMGSPEEAIEHTGEVISEATGVPWAHHLRGVAYLQLGREEEAVLDFLAAIQTDEENRERLGTTYFQLGIAYQNLRRFDRAVAAFEKAVKSDPDSSDCYAALAMACLYSARFERASECFEKARELDPEVTGYFHALGALYELGGEYDSACGIHERATSLRPEDRFGLASFNYRWDELEKAMSVVNELLEDDAENQAASDLSARIENQNRLRERFDEDKQAPRLKYFVNFGGMCLPCSLAAVLNYWDVETTPQEVAKTVRDAGFYFRNPQNVFVVIEDSSLEVSICDVSESKIEEFLAAGFPVILGYQQVLPEIEESEDPPDIPGHALVITGCDPSERILRIDDPGRKRNYLMTYDEAFGEWTASEERRPIALAIHPPDRPVASAPCPVEGLTRARYLQKMEQPIEAMREYARLAGEFPDDAEVHSEMALAGWALGVVAVDTARKQALHSLRINPDDGLARAILARRELMSGNLGDAVHLFARALECPGHTLDDHVAYAKLLEDRGDKDEAVQTIREGIEQHSDASLERRITALGGLLLVYSKAGDTEEAELLLARLMEIGKLDHNAQHEAGRALYYLKQYDRAMQHIRSAILLEPDDACHVSDLACCHLKRKEWDQAIEAAEKAVAMGHEHSGDYLVMALAYRRLGRRDEAIQAAEKELELFPANDEAKNLLERLEHQEDAVEPLKEERELFQENEVFRDLLREIEQPDDAAGFLKLDDIIER